MDGLDHDCREESTGVTAEDLIPLAERTGLALAFGLRIGRVFQPTAAWVAHSVHFGSPTFSFRKPLKKKKM
jgi:hypothetical protein